MTVRFLPVPVLVVFVVSVSVVVLQEFMGMLVLMPFGQM